MNPTALQQLAGLILKQDLDHWVAKRKAEGQSWDRIAQDLAVATRGQVTLSGQTLRRWYRTTSDDAA